LQWRLVERETAENVIWRRHEEFELKFYEQQTVIEMLHVLICSMLPIWP
jgi:hypothetical protein